MKATLDDDSDDSGDECLDGSVPMEDLVTDPGLSILAGLNTNLTRAELIAQLPSKELTDKIIHCWASNSDPISMIIHLPSFFREYNAFWEDPSHTPTMWIALLFGIMTMTGRLLAFSASAEVDNLLEAEKIDHEKYFSCAASAMCLGDFTKPQDYALEALWIFVFTGILRAGSFNTRTWMLCAIGYRLALRMGYHRDPDNYPNTLTPFQGEMRRRIWLTVVHADTLTSFYIGLPGMAHSVRSDTKPPRNLLDCDFDTDTKELPPSRPPTEFTPVSYSIIKAKISNIFSISVSVALGPDGHEYSTILSLDNELDAIQLDLPKCLQARYFDSRIVSSVQSVELGVLICGFNFAIMYHKAKCIIHRRHLSVGWRDQRYRYSLFSAVHSALELLHFHQRIHQSCLPGGRLAKAPWYICTLNTNDFLLASMILCLTLSLYAYSKQAAKTSDSGENADPTKPTPPMTKAQMNSIITALDRAYDLFAELAAKGGEVKKGASMIREMIDKVKPMIDALGTEDDGPTSSSSGQTFTPEWSQRGSSASAEDQNMDEPMRDSPPGPSETSQSQATDKDPSGVPPYQPGFSENGARFGHAGAADRFDPVHGSLPSQLSPPTGGPEATAPASFVGIFSPSTPQFLDGNTFVTPDSPLHIGSASVPDLGETLVSTQPPISNPAAGLSNLPPVASGAHVSGNALPTAHFASPADLGQPTTPSPWLFSGAIDSVFSHSPGPNVGTRPSPSETDFFPRIPDSSAAVTVMSPPSVPSYGPVGNVGQMLDAPTMDWDLWDALVRGVPDGINGANDWSVPTCVLTPLCPSIGYIPSANSGVGFAPLVPESLFQQEQARAQSQSQSQSQAQVSEVQPIPQPQSQGHDQAQARPQLQTRKGHDGVLGASIESLYL